MEILTVLVSLLPFVLISRAFLKNDALALTAGLGYLAFLMFFLGILQLYDPRVLWGVVALHYLFSILLYGRSLPSRLIGKFADFLDTWKKDSLLNKGLLSFAGLLVLFNLLGAYIPQTGDDALGYHFALPKLFIQHGGLYFYPYSLMSAWPFNIEMLFTFGMLLQNDITANLLNVVVGLAFSLMVYHLVTMYLGRTQGLLWAAVSYSTPLTLTQARNALVDLGVGLFALAGLYLLLTAVRKKKLNAGIAVLSGVFFGWAAGSKPMGALAGLLSSVALFGCYFRHYRRRMIFYSGLIALFTGLVASPWYVRSFLHTGNPVYPALYSVFGGKDLNDAVELRLKNLVNSQHVNLAPLGRSLTGFLASPFFLHYPRLVVPSAPTGASHFSYLSLVFSPFGFLFVLRRKHLRKEASFMAMVSSLFFVAWFFYLTQEGRYLTPVLGILYLFSAFGLAYLREDSGSRWLQRAAAGACALWFPAALGIHGLYYSPKAYGAVHRQDYLERFGHLHRSVTWANSHLGKGKKIALLSEMGPYYLDIPYIHLGPAFRLFDLPDGRALYDFLKKENVTHFLVAKDSSENYLLTDGVTGNTNIMIYLFRTDAPTYEAERARGKSTYPITDLLSDPAKAKLVYRGKETPVLTKIPLSFLDPVRVEIHELN